MAGAGRMMQGQRHWRLPAMWWLLAALLSAWMPPGARAAEPATAGMTLQLFFPNQRLNPDSSDCSAVFPVERQVRQLEKARQTALATTALRQLLAGPSASERAAGYHSIFSASSADLLRRVRIRGATAYVDLADFRFRLPGSSSSCGAAEFHSQIEQTLLQFKGIKRVRYAIEGDPRRFHDWMGEPCGKRNGYCAWLPGSQRERPRPRSVGLGHQLHVLDHRRLQEERSDDTTPFGEGRRLAKAYGVVLERGPEDGQDIAARRLDAAVDLVTAIACCLGNDAIEAMHDRDFEVGSVGGIDADVGVFEDHVSAG